MMSKELEGNYDFINYGPDNKEDLSSDAKSEIAVTETNLRILTVEFVYSLDTHLQDVLDEVIVFIDDNDLSLASIHSMFTTSNVNDDLVLVVSFEVYDG